MSGGKQRCPCQCHWDLSWLKFGDGKIATGDVDGLFIVERKGRFLWLYTETKRPGELLTEGQKFMLKALSSVQGFTVLIIRGPQSQPEELIVVKNGQFGWPEQTDRQKFQERIDDWYKRANAHV